ncbi:MAG: segregation/condensation protein A [Chlorobiaceae bacterium]|nr:segregation/condensation protein A [Chlorobiales bacterium]NTU91490.1 segregation/condensation protein A [Chlorobiaceae bacterium]NTV25700.1 segregation/condensation protein A [Chlorobiaceae bacterium]
MFRISLDEFEGPLDLLLFFIRRDELDIYNIPISKITGDFIDYIRTMQNLNLEVAAEFIYMASMLMSIKARMLLPRPEEDVVDDGEFDPRTELVQRLLEYKRIKEGASDLEFLAIDRERMFPAGFFEKFEPEVIDEMDEEVNRPTLYHLMLAYQSVMDNMPKVRLQNVVEAPVTVEEQSALILERLRSRVQVSFSSLFEDRREAIVLVVTFLAVLELCRNRRVVVVVKDGYNDFWISQREPVE